MSRRNGYSAHTSPLPYVRIFGPGSLQISNPAITPFIAPGAPYIAPGAASAPGTGSGFLRGTYPRNFSNPRPTANRSLCDSMRSHGSSETKACWFPETGSLPLLKIGTGQQLWRKRSILRLTSTVCSPRPPTILQRRKQVKCARPRRPNLRAPESIPTPEILSSPKPSHLQQSKCNGRGTLYIQTH